MVNLKASSLLEERLSFRLLNEPGSRMAVLKYKKRLHIVPLCSKLMPVTGGALILKMWNLVPRIRFTHNIWCCVTNKHCKRCYIFIFKQSGTMLTAHAKWLTSSNIACIFFPQGHFFPANLNLFLDISQKLPLFWHIGHANRGDENTCVFNKTILNKMEDVQKLSGLNFMFQRIPELVRDFENNIEAK